MTLLRDGFGFKPNSRDITFSFLVEGNEVEWSLGMALVAHTERAEYIEESGKLKYMQPGIEVDNYSFDHSSNTSDPSKVHCTSQVCLPFST